MADILRKGTWLVCPYSGKEKIVAWADGRHTQFTDGTSCDTDKLRMFYGDAYIAALRAHPTPEREG